MWSENDNTGFYKATVNIWLQLNKPANANDNKLKTFTSDDDEDEDYKQPLCVKHTIISAPPKAPEVRAMKRAPGKAALPLVERAVHLTFTLAHFKRTVSASGPECRGSCNLDRRRILSFARHAFLDTVASSISGGV